MNAAPAHPLVRLVLCATLASTFSCTCGAGAASTTTGGMPDAGKSLDAGKGIADAGKSGDAGMAFVPVELCGNGKDDDLDGLVDEDCGCTPGAVRSCFSGNPAQQAVGECRAGKQSCTEEGELRTVWGACVGEVVPATETCNGLDDDCDGFVDDSLSRACSSACGMGAEVCTSGAWGSCSAALPSTEICNGLDDDCDGQIDESLARACSSICGAGVEVCTAGVYGSCNARVPIPEVCNALDDDCDGQVDEGLSRACSTICGAGTEVCANGSYGMCSAQVPVAEICGNMIDDDCDGQIDEGCLCIKSPSQSAWQMHLGEAPMCYGTTFGSHGEVGEYAYSTIPAENAPGWTNHAAPAISFDDPSQMCGVCGCRAGGDFTYFQTSFQIPMGFNVQSLTVNIVNVDDGVRVTVFNSAHPFGAVMPGSYAYLGGGSTSNLASLVAPGANRIVLTHLDDCCAERRIENATVSLNGSAINPCP
jgi:hypothetical protein